MIDGGRYAESWKEGAAVFKGSITEAGWVAALETLRRPLGGIVSRELISAQHTTTLPGAPDGEYVVIQYRAEFSKKKNAVEMITPMLDEDGTWRISGYYIQ
jgi:hypothetical protein